MLQNELVKIKKSNDCGLYEKTAFGNDFKPREVPQPENAWNWKCRLNGWRWCFQSLKKLWWIFLHIWNLEGHQYRITGSRVTAISLNGWILPIGGNSAVEGLRSTGLHRLVLKALSLDYINLKKIMYHHQPHFSSSIFSQDIVVQQSAL